MSNILRRMRKGIHGPQERGPQTGEFVLQLKTQIGADELRSVLREFEPWSHQIDFSNGISTADFSRRVPFNAQPLFKIRKAAEAIPFERLRRGRALDIGCNTGYNCIHMAREYQMSCTGIDINPGLINAANILAGIAGIDAEFLLADAEAFRREAHFDVILHFGTLYHLRNPFVSLQACHDSLRAGGYLALEAQVYEHPDDENICYFIHMVNNDASNFWALSPHVLEKCLELVGYRNIRTLWKAPTPIGGQYMARLLLVAEK